jgi:hypothetical protein
MDYFLTFLKFFGTILSGYGAIIAAIPDHRRSRQSKDSKLHTIWNILIAKEFGIYVAIIGLFVAVVSQLIENKLDGVRDEEAKRSTDRLLRNILRLETRFNMVQLNLICSFSPADSTFEGLHLSNISGPYEVFLYQPIYLPHSNESGNSGYLNFQGVSSNNIIVTTSFAPFDNTFAARKYDGVIFSGSQRYGITLSRKQFDELNALYNYSVFYLEFEGDSGSPYGSNFGAALYCTNQPNYLYYSPEDNSLQLSASFCASEIGSLNTSYASISDLPNRTITVYVFNACASPGETNWDYKLLSIKGNLQIGDFNWPINMTNSEPILSKCKRVGVSFSLKCPFTDMSALGY